ncbi:MAG: VCBS repeat-containing protein, partial [SAR324 cluster bacterium]|nr:VCBS repeat-containing protein [SAR324 cluster bacterium]
IGDWNPDAFPDLAVIESEQDAVVVLTGDGTGAFTVIGLPFPQLGTAYDIVTGDFDSDGDADLVVSNRLTSFVSYLEGAGDGTFTTTPQVDLLDAAGLPERMVTGNFTTDGLDVAVLQTFERRIAFLDGNDAGGFSRFEISVSDEPYTIGKGDFNADGNCDLVVAERELRLISILNGNGAGGFGRTVIGFDTALRFPTVLDFDGNGIDDLLLLHPGLDRLVLLQNCHPAISTPSTPCP